ncbi:hypothetical protein ACFL2Y_04445 [Candidatus Omnitrophota bacterium]
MKKLSEIFVLVFIFSILFSLLYSYAEERITLTTYYPAPYGVYREMRVNGLAVGSAYRNNPTNVADGYLLVNGSVGIGTMSPESKLHLFIEPSGIVTNRGMHIGNLAPAGTVHGYGTNFNTAAGHFVALKDGVEVFSIWDSGHGYFAGNLTVDDEIFAGDDVSIAGKVGIGTTNPTTRLHIEQSASFQGVYVGDGTTTFPEPVAGYSTDFLTGAAYHFRASEADSEVFSVKLGGEGYFAGNVTVDDVWLANANGGAGRWASERPTVFISGVIMAKAGIVKLKLGAHQFCALKFTRVWNVGGEKDHGYCHIKENTPKAGEWELEARGDNDCEASCQAICLDF